jgi:serine/threonine protein kinase
VYEYAANGSLDRFLKDDDMRAGLSAATRLSIMYQVARAVRFLHNGAAGFKVLHRDIKSANICLTEDLTPKLIDCGLAKFVEKKHTTFSKGSIIQTGSTQGPVIGTIGYMCPEYASTTTQGIKCDYIPAYDVYSIGVVMAELILGHLNGHPRNVSQAYVRNDDETPKVDGWKRLKDDVDKNVTWKADALEVVCLTTIGCLIQTSQGRLSTIKLLDLLKHAIDLQAADSNVEPEVERVDSSPEKRPRTDAVIGKLDAILFKIGKAKSEPKGGDLGLCIPCNRQRAVIKCSVGHALCADCIEEAILAPGAKNGDRHLPCLIEGCLRRFHDRDLSRHIKGAVYTYFFVQPCLNIVASNVDVIQQGVDGTNQRFDKLSFFIDRFLPGLALQIAIAEQSKVCPRVVIITPSAVGGPVNLKKWIQNVNKQNYKVVFYCEHSNDKGHDPFEISVDKQWIVRYAPWLRIVLNIAEKLDPTNVIGAVTSALPILKHSKEMKALIDALGKEQPQGQSQSLEHDAYKAIANMANMDENRKKWRDKMDPVVGENEKTMWVKKEFKTLYGGALARAHQVEEGEGVYGA